MAEVKTPEELLADEQAAHAETKNALITEQSKYSNLQAALEKEQDDHTETKTALSNEQTAHTDTKQKLAKEETDHLATMEANVAAQEKIEELELLLKNAGEKVPEKAAVKKAVVPTDEFKVGDETYVFTIPAFRHKGELITAAEALNNTELQAELVEMKFGGIKRAGDK